MVDKVQLKGKDGESEPLRKNRVAIFGVRVLATLADSKIKSTPRGGAFNFGGGEGIALACGLGQGRLCLPPAAIHYRPVQLPFIYKTKAPFWVLLFYGGGGGS